MKEPIRELRCHYLVTCVYNKICYASINVKLEVEAKDIGGPGFGKEVRHGRGT